MIFRIVAKVVIHVCITLYVISLTIIQMVSRGFTSREFASRSPFAIKFANPFDTMSKGGGPLFSLQGFPTFVGHISSYCCTRNFYIVKLSFFIFLSRRIFIITHILNRFFDNISRTFKKQRLSTPWFFF